MVQKKGKTRRSGEYFRACVGVRVLRACGHGGESGEAEARVAHSSESAESIWLARERTLVEGLKNNDLNIFLGRSFPLPPPNGSIT